MSYNLNMKKLFLALLLAAALPFAARSDSDPTAFEKWRADFRVKALAKGIPDEILSATVDVLLVPEEKVIQADRRQAEFILSFSDYVRRTVSAKRILKGRELHKTHKKMLAKVRREFGVDPQYILAFWGMETEFGARKGSLPVITSVATLAYEGRRAHFFENELLA